MNKHLLLFTIGPVQSFISQARKTQDLYAGSKLLSELIKEAMRATFLQQGKIIFPFVDSKSLKQVESLPNRFIAELNLNNKQEDKLTSVGLTIEKAVRKYFKNEAKIIFKTVINNPTRSLYKEFITQINQHLDINWVFLPFNDDNYYEKLQEIDHLLGAIKNVRVFEQNIEAGRKCSLDGERNALFFGRSQPSLSIKSQREIAHTIQEGFQLEEKEGLSAVSLLKRYYKAENDAFKKFPSTAEVALMADQDEALKDEKITQCFNAYKNIFKLKEFLLECLHIKKQIKFKNKSFRNNFDYQLLFEENIDKKNIPNPEQLKFAKEVFKNLQQHFKTKYYALIAFDADSMGEWLRGNLIIDKSNLRSFHELLSQKLLAYGSWATKYLAAPKGRAVYAGGDDFLGFVNIKYLYKVMLELRQQFDAIINDEKVTQYIKGSKRISFSAGVVVAHYKMPLGEVIKLAKKMEDEAKDYDKKNKNAFTLAVLKKSGEIVKTSSKWKDDQGNFLIEDLSYLYQELDKGKQENQQAGFSPTFIKNLNLEFSVFSKDLRKDKTIPLEHLAFVEMKRLIQRSCNHTDKISKKDAVDKLNSHLQSLYKNSKYASSEVDNFLEALNISDFLTRKITQD